MNSKALINESVRNSINQILVNISNTVDEKTKENCCDPEILTKYTKALEHSLCAAQRFDFITDKCGEIIDTDTEFKLQRTITNLTEAVFKICANDTNIDELLNLIRLMDLVALSWKRLYSFGEHNPYT